MRIIEPHQLRKSSPKRHKRQIPWRLLLLILILGIGGWQIEKYISSRKLSGDRTQNQETLPSVNTLAPAAPKKLKIFTSEEFMNLYSNFAYPNTIEITTPPPITENTEADVRIRTLAEKRGYRLRSAPVALLPLTPEGFPLQEKALKPWQEMKTAAARENVSLGLSYTFRSVDEQRLIFLQRLNATRMTTEEIAAGEADEQVEEVLATTALPGYSRHHTGFAIDIKCGNDEVNLFADTICFKWLSNNNYENAKKFGWIPSYPPEIGDQGPEPESWEYVWVGVEALTE